MGFDLQRNAPACYNYRTEIVVVVTAACRIAFAATNVTICLCVGGVCVNTGTKPNIHGKQ